MTRTLSLACLLALLAAAGSFSQTKSTSATQPNEQKSTQAKPSTPPAVSDEELPPADDDDPARPKVYTFDPLECDRNIKVGNFYMHQGKPAGYRAALGRFEDATRYNPTSAEAFFKLGEAEEKLKDKNAARIAFQKVVRLAPDSKFAHEAKKKLGS